MNKGLDQARVGRLHTTMSGYVERGDLPGMVALVHRHEATHVEVLGTLAAGGGAPMRRDTIFRIASMSKPVLAVAALTLVEECRLRLDDPLDSWLPELSGRQVLRRIDAPLDDTVPAQRPLTLRDLLTFRMGFGMLFASPESHPIVAAAQSLGVAVGPPRPAQGPAADEWLRRLGSLPLMYQPGERWLYHTGSDVLGILLARVTGQELESLLRERIFAPLGMHDTGFHVPPAKLGRLATSYVSGGEHGPSEVFDPAEGGQWSQPPVFPSGGGGLVSTVDDYFAFAQMLLLRGRQGGQHILSRPAVELMTMNHLTAEQMATAGIILGERRGWGFGVEVVTERDSLDTTVGRYGWNGGLGTTWANDPKEALTGILLTQQAMGSPVTSALFQDFWTCAYQAIDQ